MQINNIFNENRSFRLHITNIGGLGATRLLESLIPSLVSSDTFKLEHVYVSENTAFVDTKILGSTTGVTFYKRFLPRIISRFLECTVFGRSFDGETPLLVLGDIPLRCKGEQVVFLQNKLLLDNSNFGSILVRIRLYISRALFKRNLGYVNSFIVQTEIMRDQLIEIYPSFKERVFIIPQPVPQWLIESHLHRKENNYDEKMGLKLFYPAAFYPHKNHSLLSKISNFEEWPVKDITLTIPDSSNPLRDSSWLKCKGTLNPEMVLQEYDSTNALLFLSWTESYGFPLVEAMWIGLPIICPDLPYARNLCKEQAIYFDPGSTSSLHLAVNELEDRLKQRWWPDWDEPLSLIPLDWGSVAEKMSEICCLGSKSA